MFIIHFQPSEVLYIGRQSFHIKIKGLFLFFNWLVEVFQQFFSEEVIPAVWKVSRSLKACFPQSSYVFTWMGTNAWWYLPICLSLVPNSLTPVWVCFQESQRGEGGLRGWYLEHENSQQWDFNWKKTKHAQTHEQGKLQHRACVCLVWGVCVCWPKRWQLKTDS